MKNYNSLFVILLLLFVSALAYLPLVAKFGYFNDDWYLMYIASAYGPNTFVDIFSVDRPGRALVMIPAYILFGENPLYYNLSAYIFRLAGALSLFWSLNLLWSGKQRLTALMSLLFLIYPGFLSQPNAIDYQSHIIGLAAALTSVALTLKAILTEQRVHKFLLHTLSILLGWFYLSQMEWYIGFELFRWGSVLLLASRLEGNLWQWGRRSISYAYPSLAIPIFFLVWRLFFFESERGATDVDLQLELLRLYPIQTVYHWGVQVFQDLFDVMLAAWVLPLSQLMGYIQWWGVVLSLLTIALIVFVFRRWNELAQQSSPTDMGREALLLGLFTAIGGLIPIAMVNREVAFPSFSRYSLVSSVGVAIFIVTLLMNVNGRLLRSGLVGGFILIALLTHHANSVKSAQETALLRTFWWQVSWRVPQIAPRTTLIANYPSVASEEDYFVWGPANLIYYPEEEHPENIQPVLFAAILNKGTVANVLARERQKMDIRKNIVTYPNHRNILILTQPVRGTCVRVINGFQPEVSQRDPDSIRVMSPYSEMEHVLAGEVPPGPPAIVFGPEPPHDWCYYYEKADLARQRGNWDEVANLGNQATEMGLYPSDNIEWMPFLQAYAQLGSVDRLASIAPEISSDTYFSQQACTNLSAMPELAPEVVKTIDSLYCAG